MGSAFGGDTCRFIGGGRGPRHIIYARGDGVWGPGVRRACGHADPATALCLGGLALSIAYIYLFPSVFNTPLAPKINFIIFELSAPASAGCYATAVRVVVAKRQL